MQNKSNIASWLAQEPRRKCT